MDLDVHIFNLLIGESLISAISFLIFVIKFVYYPLLMARFGHTIFGIVFWCSMFFFVYFLDIDADEDVEEREFVNDIRQINFELFNIASYHVPSDSFYWYAEDEYELDEVDEENFDWTDMHEEFFEFYAEDPFDEMIYWSLIFVPSGNDQEYSSTYMYPYSVADTDSVYEQWNHDIEIDYKHPSGLTGGGELMENTYETDDCHEDEYRFTFVDSSYIEMEKFNAIFIFPFFSTKFFFNLSNICENIFDFPDDIDFNRVVSELRKNRKENWETLTGDITTCGTSVSSKLLNNVYDKSVFFVGFDKSVKIDLLNVNPGTDSGNYYNFLNPDDDAFISSALDHGILMSGPGDDEPWFDADMPDPYGYFVDVTENTWYRMNELEDIYPFDDDLADDLFDIEFANFEDNSFRSIYKNHPYNVSYYSRAEYVYYSGYDNISIGFFPDHELNVMNDYDKYYSYYKSNKELVSMDDYGFQINFTDVFFYDRKVTSPEFKRISSANKEDWIYICDEKSFRLSEIFDASLSYEFSEFKDTYFDHFYSIFNMQTKVFHSIKIPELIGLIPNDKRFFEMKEKSEYVSIIPPVTISNPEDSLELDEYGGSMQNTFFNGIENMNSGIKFTPCGFYNYRTNKPVVSNNHIVSEYILEPYDDRDDINDVYFRLGELQSVFEIVQLNTWNDSIIYYEWPNVSKFLFYPRRIFNSLDIVERKSASEHLNILKFNIDNPSYMYWMAYQEILGSSAENFRHVFSEDLKEGLIDIMRKKHYNKHSESYFVENDFINYYVLECRNREINSFFASDTEDLYYEYCPPINHSDWFTSIQLLYLLRWVV